MWFDIILSSKGAVHLIGGTLVKFRGELFWRKAAIFSSGASIFSC